MKILLYQLDGKIPNIALMRVAAHHRALGDEVELRWTHSSHPEIWDTGDELVYASTIFERTRPHAEDLLLQWPNAQVGGTGWDVASSLEAIGIETLDQDYSLYPKWRQSIGFTQRGCRLRCKFCVVPRKEGAIRFEGGKVSSSSPDGWSEISIDRWKPLEREWQAFAESVVEDSTSPVDAQWGTYTSAVAIAALESTASGEFVMVGDTAR